MTQTQHPTDPWQGVKLIEKVIGARRDGALSTDNGRTSINDNKGTRQDHKRWQRISQQ